MSSEPTLDSGTEMPSLEFGVDESAASIRSVRLVTVPRNLEVGSFETDVSLNSVRLSQPILSADTLDRPSLPPELWIDIINRLRSSDTPWLRSPSVPKRPDIKSLTPLLTVSKTINHAVEPFLYEWVVLSFDEESDSPRDLLLSSLYTRPHRLDWVKYLIIKEGYSWWKDELRPLTNNALGALFPALKCLRGISMNNALVPPYMTNNPRLFQALDVFESRDSILEVPVGSVFGDGFPSIRHAILEGYERETLRESNIRLATLVLGTHLETLQISPDLIHAFLASLAPGSTIVFDRLRTLYTTMEEGSSSYSNLFRMLQYCPSITTLDVFRVPFDRWTTQLAPPVADVARHLQTLAAPSDLANLLVPSRPIRSLSLRNHISLKEPALEWLAKSTAPLTRLCLQVLAQGMLRDISRIFPSLEELHFQFPDGSTYKPWPVEQLAPLRDLRALSFRCSNWKRHPPFVGGENVAVQLAMLKALEINHPRLASVILGDDMEWQKRPENGKWTRRIAPAIT